MGVGGQCHALAALPPGKTWYPLYRRLGGPQGQSGEVWKILPQLRFEPQTIQPVASHCTYYTILAHEKRKYKAGFEVLTAVLLRIYIWDVMLGQWCLCFEGP
jgi:hypothetical protein